METQADLKEKEGAIKSVFDVEEKKSYKIQKENIP